MVALITGSSLQLSGPAPVQRPRLRVIQGGLDAPERDYSSVAVAVAVSLVLLVVIGLRMLQGGPPVDLSSARASSAGASAVAVAEPGETMLVVQSGDSLWAIAEDLAPGRDPRPIVDALADRNGGTVLRAGDVLVVPVELQPAQPTAGIAAGATGSTP